MQARAQNFGNFIASIRLLVQSRKQASKPGPKMCFSVIKGRKMHACQVALCERDSRILGAREVWAFQSIYPELSVLVWSTTE